MERSTKALAERQFSLGGLTDGEAEELFRILRQVRAACGAIGEESTPGLRT
jgi:hypothetical protein